MTTLDVEIALLLIASVLLGFFWVGLLAIKDLILEKIERRKARKEMFDRLERD